MDTKYFENFEETDPFYPPVKEQAAANGKRITNVIIKFYKF